MNKDIEMLDFKFPNQKCFGWGATVCLARVYIYLHVVEQIRKKILALSKDEVLDCLDKSEEYLVEKKKEYSEQERHYWDVLNEFVNQVQALNHESSCHRVRYLSLSKLRDYLKSLKRCLWNECR